MLTEELSSAWERQHQRLRQSIPKLIDYAGTLDQQDRLWESVTLLATIHHQRETPQLLDAIESAHAEFRSLRERLLYNITERHIDKISIELDFKAQTIIDILVRNLFERTADVGFLATDATLIEFMRTPQPTADHQAHIQARLEHYQAKYTVYDDIILLNTAGHVQARLNTHNQSIQAHDPFTQKAMLGVNSHVEHYGPSPLITTKENALLYGRAIVADGQVIGALILSFNLEQELAMIFSTLINPKDAIILGVLGENGKILASSDTRRFPIGRRMPATAAGECLQRGGERYFVSRCVTRGFQDYAGFPWQGVALLPLSQAFQTEADTQEQTTQVLQSLLFPQDLQNFNQQIRTALRIVILNGKIVSLKRHLTTFLPILETFQAIGDEVSHVFGESIYYVHRISMKTAANEAKFSAMLAADILDRNLYERANDCRWWALDPILRTALSHPDFTEADRLACTQVLRYINSLYTVYTNLLFYDRSGIIRAMSSAQDEKLLAHSLADLPEVQACLRLSDQQQYTVSDYLPTPFYNSRPTYIYHAAVRHTDNDRHVVGGIGIVFDSAQQLAAILEDTVPRDRKGAIRSGAVSAFCSASGQVLEVTSNSLGIEPGMNIVELVRVDPYQLEGQGAIPTIIESSPYILGYKLGSGYREFKRQDGYNNGIIAVTLLPS